MKQHSTFDSTTETDTTERIEKSAASGWRASKGAIGFLRAALLLIVFAIPAIGQEAQINGALTGLKIQSKVMGEERVILVRTPQGYETNEVRYPVLYMTDGNAHIAHTSSTIDFLARNGRMSEMIVVGILNTDRTRDLTPTHASMPQPNGDPIQFPTSGGADKFLKFIETEVIPMIEARYRTQPYRIFAGHSFGGLFAINAMLTRPDLFNAYIAVSPSLQWDNFIMVKRADEFFKARKEFNKTLFISLGNEPGDITEGFNQFKEVLTKNKVKGLDWDSQMMKDEDHGSVVLRSHYFGLRKIFDGWQLARNSETGAIVGTLQGVEDHYKKLSQKFGYQILVPEALMNQIGYQLLGAGRSDEAISAFKSNVERYPASANVYDSLAEAYEKSGRLDLAKPNYEKAFTLGKQNNDPNVNVYKTNFERVSAKTSEGDSAMKKQ